jgi:hypothetical protein
MLLEELMSFRRLIYHLKRTISAFSFDGEVSFGDVLTSFSILLSVTALVFSMQQDRQQRDKEQADRIRTAAAEALVKFEQWKEISLYFLQDIQSPLVQTSEKFTEHLNTIETRDFLWRQLDEKRFQYFERLRNESIANSYIGLYGYHASAGKLTQKTMQDLTGYEKVMFEEMRMKTQNVVLSYKDVATPNYQSAMMGNDLRNIVAAIQGTYEKKIENDVDCIEQYLAALILEDDATLLDNRQSANTVQPCRKTSY